MYLNIKSQLNCFLSFHVTFQWKKFLAAKNFAQWNALSKETASDVISSFVLLRNREEVICKNEKCAL